MSLSRVRILESNRSVIARVNKVHAASLNYRDLIIAKGTYPFAVTDNRVPGSDGAGVVEMVGKYVTKFKKGGTDHSPVTAFNTMLTHQRQSNDTVQPRPYRWLSQRTIKENWSGRNAR